MNTVLDDKEKREGVEAPSAPVCMLGMSIV